MRVLVVVVMVAVAVIVVVVVVLVALDACLCVIPSRGTDTALADMATYTRVLHACVGGLGCVSVCDSIKRH